MSGKAPFIFASVSLLAGVALAPTAQASCQTTGPQRIALLSVSMPHDALPAGARARVEQAFFGKSFPSLPTYWNAVSHGQVSLEGESLPPSSPGSPPGSPPEGAGSYLLDRDLVHDGSDRSVHEIAAAAIRAASRDTSLSAFDRIAVVVPRLKDAYGVSTMGCETFWSAQGPIEVSATLFSGRDLAGASQEFTMSVVAHEMGHALGLDHAGTVMLGPPGSDRFDDDTGNQFSMMGGTSYVMPYDFLEKLQLGWESFMTIATIPHPGTYRILPSSSPERHLKALRIPRGGGEFLTVEYRRPDASWGLPRWLFPQVLVYLEGTRPRGAGKHQTLLVDSARLRVGREWADPGSSIRITVLSEEERSAELDVSY